jgi:DNA-directed RNA polymerase I subunit RPA2
MVGTLGTYNGVPKALEDLAQPHVESFDFFVGDGLKNLVRNMRPVEVVDAVEEPWNFWISDIVVERPQKDEASTSVLDMRLLPRECREAGTTYRAPLVAEVSWKSGSSSAVMSCTKRLGQLPIMLKSQACYLKHMSMDELRHVGEEGTEFGGYFICNGIERIIRMLIVTRRHYILALKRGAYRKRGPLFSEFGTTIRCVRNDESSITNRCHYLSDGGVVFSIVLNKAEYFVPAAVLLKCLCDVSEKELYESILALSKTDDAHAIFVAERAEVLLSQCSRLGLVSKRQCLEYLGNLFRGVLGASETRTDFEVGSELIRENLFVHLEDGRDKLNLAYQMISKLYALVNGQCAEDNPDALTHQEALLPGHLLLKFMREQLEVCLDALKDQVRRDRETESHLINFHDEAYGRRLLERWPDVGQKFEYLLNTGNMISRSGLDLSQATGFTVVAEKLNFYRYVPSLDLWVSISLRHFPWSDVRGRLMVQTRTRVVQWRPIRVQAGTTEADDEGFHLFRLYVLRMTLGSR